MPGTVPEKTQAQPPAPELRRDPITGEWVILAAGRSVRPHAPGGRVSAPAPEELLDQCPLCPGREELTPPEICAVREGGGRDCPGWSVRTLPNKFPILVSGAPHAGSEKIASNGRRPALGSSEVIVDTPLHNKPPWEIGAPQVKEMLEMYQERIRALKNQSRTSYVHIIRNHGRGAASSLEHPHSQLFGLPFVPPDIDSELDGFAAASADKAGCILCRMIGEVEEKGELVVMESESFLVFCPFASRLPYEAWIVPRSHQPGFEECTKLDELADLFTSFMLRLKKRLDDPPFNYWIHTYPLKDESRPYHWHIEVLPRLTTPGGLELGAGVWVNIVAPEQAAAELR